MSNKAKPLTVEASIPFVEKTIKCTLQSLYEVGKATGKSDYERKLAYAMCHIQTSIDTLKRTEEDLKFCLLESLKGC